MRQKLIGETDKPRDFNSSLSATDSWKKRQQTSKITIDLSSTFIQLDPVDI